MASPPLALRAVRAGLRRVWVPAGGHPAAGQAGLFTGQMLPVPQMKLHAQAQAMLVAGVSRCSRH